MLHAMIMAGGGGTRFWPRSRKNRPKQFLTFTGERTLLQGTRDRLAAPIAANATWVLTGAAHVHQACEQLPDLIPEHIIGEPMGRDTAACIGLGAALIAIKDANATMIVTPADHLIEPEREFHRAVQAAEQFIADHPDALLTFGIPPTFPATGYGYIQRGEAMGDRLGVAAAKVKAFKEKPNVETAEQFLISGDYLWNSGIFVWKVATILKELQRQRPQLHAAIMRIAAAWETPDQDTVFAKEYEAIEKISIDYAVMENAANVIVIQAPYQWDDVGSWLALERRNPQDADGNTIQGQHTGINTSHCVIVSDPDHLITTIGVKDLLIVQDDNATLVADRNDEEAVKQLVEKLKQNREMYL